MERSGNVGSCKCNVLKFGVMLCVTADISIYRYSYIKISTTLSASVHTSACMKAMKMYSKCPILKMKGLENVHDVLQNLENVNAVLKVRVLSITNNITFHFLCLWCMTVLNSSV